MNYEMKELLPIVAELADKFTSKEKTSVSYDTARHLMEAVLYCIDQCCEQNQLMSKQRLSAREAYQLGYKRLISKTRETQKFYNEMILDFFAYGNENYHDTVTRAIPGFFRYYDARFAPQETIITMDYPTIWPLNQERGIDAIQKYVTYISYEQIFMNRLPEDYVYDVLNRYQANYRKQFYNICAIILRHILAIVVIGKHPGQRDSGDGYELLKKKILEEGDTDIEKQFSFALHKLITEQYDGNEDMELYFQADIRNFSVELRVAAENNQLRRVVVL